MIRPSPPVKISQKNDIIAPIPTNQYKSPRITNPLQIYEHAILMKDLFKLNYDLMTTYNLLYSLIDIQF